MMKIGIVGGGQLGMMMVEDSKDKPFEFVGLDPSQNCPLTFETKDMIFAEYCDSDAFKKLIEKVDVATYEFENVDFDLIKKYERKFPQKLKALEKSKNRIIEKNYATKLGIKTPKYHIYNKEYLFTYPVIVKTTTGGYDGKGQFVCNSKEEYNSLPVDTNVEYIIEEKILFDYEISVVATRDQYGTIAYYPITRNTHKNGILHSSKVLVDQEARLTVLAREYTKRLLVDLDYVGTLAVEYFVQGTDVVFNEFAPRPHNSGHYTIEGCNVSQFQNHILAVAGEKVIQPKLLKPTIMFNILGQHMSKIDILKELGNVHLYHKAIANINRKMGHITITAETSEMLETLIKKIEEVLS